LVFKQRKTFFVFYGPSGVVRGGKWGHVPRSAGLGGASTAQHTLFNHLKTSFKQKFKPKYTLNRVFFWKKL